MATQNFINECKNMANANRLGKFELQMYDRIEKEFKGNTIQRNLPSQYTQVAYIEKTNDTSYLDTNLALETNFKIEVDFSLNEYNSSYEQPFVSTWGSSPNYFNLFVKPYNPNQNYLDLYVKAHNYISSGVINLNEKNIVSIERNGNNWTTIHNGNTTTFSNSTLGTNDTTLKVFARGDLQSQSLHTHGKIYKLRIYKDNVLVRDYVPCYRNGDSKVGLYDLVNDEFYSNSGTGSFTYGSITSNAPNPDFPQEIQSVTGLQNVNVCGKNLFNTSNAESRTHNGITFTLNNDGSITANGTATSLAFMLVLSQAQSPLYKAGNYAFSLVNEMPNNCYVRFEFFDSNNTMILRKDITKNGTATLLQNCYLKVSYVIASGTVLNNFVNYIQIEKGSTATTYEPYKGNTYEVNLGNIKLNKIGTYQDSIKKSTGKNLFDKSTIIEGKYIDGSGNVQTDANNFIGDYIEIDNTKTYYVSSNYSTAKRVVYYNSSKTFISREVLGVKSSVLTIPNNAKYIVLSCYNEHLDTLQLEQNSTATSYEPYGKVWYIEKQVSVRTLNGTENWAYTSNKKTYYLAVDDIVVQNIQSNMMDIASNLKNYGTVLNNDSALSIEYGFFVNNQYVHIRNKNILNNINNFKTWLASNQVKVLIPLKETTTTEITDETLINQLEAIELLKGTNNITITSENLPVIFDYSFWNGDTEVDEDDRFLEVNQSNYLTSIELKDSCSVNNNILGTTYTKSAEVELLDLPVGTKLESQIITPEIGVKYNDDTTEYETFDDYVIESLNDEQTASNTKFTAMNGSTLLDKEYVCSLSFENGQTHTINEFYQDACSQIGLTPTDSIFDNSEIVMTGNPFTNKETIRTVISEVEKTSCSIAKFDWKNKTISLTWLSDQIDYEFNTSDYSTLEGSLTQYGPLNTIIIANSQLDGENVVMTDEESVAEYGEHQIIIDSPYFLYTEDLRTQAIQAIYNKLDGLTYYDLKLTTPYGKPFLNIGDKIRINTNEGQTYDTYVLTHTLTYDGTIQSIIESPALTQEEQTIKNEFKGNSVREKLRRTELMVDKTTGDITAITDRVTTVENEFGDVYSKEEVNTLVQNAATGITNTFSSSGGNNLLRNTGLWFEDRSTIEYLYPTSSLYPSNDLFMSADPHWEYWKGNAKKVKEDKASNMSGILLQTGYFEQQQTLRNGTYTLSFKYRKLNQLATVNVQINDRYIELTSTEDTEMIEVGNITTQNISIKIFSDTDDSCVIYDLMLNAGSEKAEYSQHQNETTTDTVNISKGITIQSSDTNTTFKANSDGIRVYNSKDMDTPITEYTDTGMDTNRIKVKDEAEIIQVLWKNVGNNTWITRL